MNTSQDYTIRPIGIIHSPYKTPSEAPRQGTTEHATVELFPEYAEGLQDLEGFSHAHLFYWLHLSNGYSLMVQPPWNTGQHGVFATRSPHRPNPLGHSVVKLLSINDNKLTIEGIDAIEGTPVVDIKPYISTLDVKYDVSNGWAAEKLRL